MRVGTPISSLNAVSSGNPDVLAQLRQPCLEAWKSVVVSDYSEMIASAILSNTPAMSTRQQRAHMHKCMPQLTY